MTKPNRFKITILFLLFSLCSLLSLFLTHYPDDYGYTHAPQGSFYTGHVSWFDPWDISVYTSAIRWGGRDGWFFKNVYTTINLPSAPIFHIYLGLGKIGKLFGWSPQFTFEIGAIALSLPFLLFLTYFTGYFTQTKLAWILAFFFMVLGGGLGWLLFPSLKVPDVYVPGFTIESALHRPHEALSSLFYLALMLFSFKSINENSRKFTFFAALTTILLSFQHPYMLLPYFLVVGVFDLFLVLSRKKQPAFLFFGATLLAAVFYVLVSFKLFITNPSFGGLLGQIQKSADPLMMALGYGILSPFILYKLVKGEVKDTKWQFLRIWFLVQFATLYLPLGFQRLLIRGLWYPACLLAAWGVVEVVKKSRQLLFPLFLLILLVPLSSIYIFNQRINEIPRGNRWIYLTQEEKLAFAFLEKNTPKERTVLSSYRVSNHLPAHTDSWVFAGHEFQSPDFSNRQQEVQRFYGGKMNQTEMKEFLHKNNIRYIFYGPEEKQISTFLQDQHIPFKPVFSNNLVTIFTAIP